MIGPLAHVSGAVVESDCFLATGCAIYNGAVIGRGSTVAVHGVVHVDTICPPGIFIPIGHIALGERARIYSPAETGEFHAELFKLGFTKVAFGFDSASMSNADATRELCRRYARQLARGSKD